MWTYCHAIFVLLLAVGTYGEDKSVTVGNITTKVKGQSGKIAVFKGMNESDGVTITFDSIEEIDENGGIIKSHSYNNFAQLTFTFSDPENSTYPNSNASVTQFSFTSSVPLGSDGTATLKSYVYIFTADGNITVDGNETEVKEGDMKFNAEISNWPFCATCTAGNKDLTGVFLDFSVEIKGKKSANKTESSGGYDLGDGASVITPKEVIYFEGNTNTTENMPSGYPALITKGSKQIFVFRFKKFTGKVLYDPVVQLGTGNGTDGGDTDGGNTDGDSTEKEVAAAGVVANVLGNSGKITIMKAGEKADSDNKLTVEFKYLVEKKSDGADIKDSSHGINSFASQTFTFSTVVNENYMNTSIAVSRITFESTLKNGAMLKVHLYVFRAGGNITQNDESMIVEQGNVKFNVEIRGWTFCSDTQSCQQNEIGEYLDFDIVMKGKGGDAKKKDGPENKYDLGSGTVLLSKKVKVDGTIVNMEGDYPKAMTKGSMQVFRFRFPKFTSDILYDPIFSLGEDGTNGAVRVTFSSLLIAALCYLFHML